MNDGNWRKSTYSSGEGGQCVEVGQSASVLVRDSKASGAGPVLHLPSNAWTTFLYALRS